MNLETGTGLSINADFPLMTSKRLFNHGMANTKVHWIVTIRTISNNVIKEVQRTGGDVYVYDPVTSDLSPWIKQGNAI